MKNHSIGVLLEDLTGGSDLEVSIRKYEAIMAPTHYKRPKAIFTKKMVEETQGTLRDLGLLDSLKRRFATLDDIKVSNILYLNRDLAKSEEKDIFQELQGEAKVTPRNFSQVGELSISKFVLELFLAPQVTGSPSLFKWGNGFSWVYNGNITDSIKERVKASGGNTQGVLRFSIQWDKAGDNENDLDAHCIEPKILRSSIPPPEY